MDIGSVKHTRQIRFTFTHFTRQSLEWSKMQYEASHSSLLLQTEPEFWRLRFGRATMAEIATTAASAAAVDPTTALPSASTVLVYQAVRAAGLGWAVHCYTRASQLLRRQQQQPAQVRVVALQPPQPQPQPPGLALPDQQMQFNVRIVDGRGRAAAWPSPSRFVAELLANALIRAIAPATRPLGMLGAGAPGITMGANGMTFDRMAAGHDLRDADRPMHAGVHLVLVYLLATALSRLGMHVRGVGEVYKQGAGRGEGRGNQQNWLRNLTFRSNLEKFGTKDFSLG